MKSRAFCLFAATGALLAGPAAAQLYSPTDPSSLRRLPRASKPSAPAQSPGSSDHSVPSAKPGVSETSRPNTSAAPAEQAGVSGAPMHLNYSDERPLKERKTRTYLTLWRFSCSFGVEDIGDEFVDRVGQLRHDLASAYGDRLIGKTIIVDHYHLYLNERAMEGSHNLGTAAFGIFAIGLGAGAKTREPACSRANMPEGWFDPAELTTPWSPFIAEMDIRIDGEEYSVHSVYSPPKNMPAPGILSDFDVAAEHAAVHAAVDKANAAMVGKRLGPPTGDQPSSVSPSVAGVTPAPATATTDSSAPSH